jgi:hypothetical protein
MIRVWNHHSWEHISCLLQLPEEQALDPSRIPAVSERLPFSPCRGSKGGREFKAAD